MAQQSGILQVVNGTGEFNEDGLNAFIRRHGIQDIGVGYQIVAITGPQSSGKSTLMNALFGTTFEEMDALSGRRQTTKGIWLAAAGKVAAPRTLLLDLEGSDGRERGEDDNSFERQSSLFALAVADCLLVNMWAKDVGREAGAGKPLLKTIFQVNLKLFTPAPNRRRTVLLFVFRDRTRTPLARLIETWEEDLRQMWAAITKPPDYEQLSFTDFFEVQYASLPNFEEREEEFRAESVLLRRRFTEEDHDSLVRPASDRLPGHALALSLHKVWEVIQHQKDLNLPAHKVMVANIRCAEIAEEQLHALAEDQAWRALAAEAGSGLVPSFGARAAALLDSCLTGYDEEARYFEDGVRRAKAAELAQRAQALIRGAYDAQMGHLRATVLTRLAASLDGRQPDAETFAACAARSKQEALAAWDEGAAELHVAGTDWDTAGPRQEVLHAMDAHVSELRGQKVAEFEASAQKALQKAIAGPASALLDRCPPDLWPRLNRLLASSLAKTSQIVAEGLEGYEVPQPDLAALHARLEAFAGARIEAAAREAANTALPRMKERFTEAFSKDEAGLPRTWGASANIQAANAAARLAAAQLLAQLAVLRLGTGPQAGQPDGVERAVVEHATEGSGRSGHEAGARGSRAGGSGEDDFDIVAANDWPGVPPNRALLGPAQCRTLWRQFSSDSAYAVQQAQATQEANRAASNRWPPFWAIAAMLVLGWNEFLAVLYNPLWLLAALVLFLFGKTVYEELDVDAEMARGVLPGALALSAKFGPVVQRVAQRCADAARQFVADPAAFSERVGEKVSEKVAAARERMGVPDSHSATDEAPAAAGIMNGTGNSGVRKRRVVGAVEMTERPEHSEASTAF